MQIEIHDDKKLVCIWLTRTESADASVRERLKPLYKAYKDRKYMVGLYRSGDQNLLEMTEALLRYNKRASAEREVQAEKKKAVLPVCR